MKNRNSIISVDGTLYSLLRDKRVFFDLIELSGRERKNVEVLSYSIDKRILVIPGASIKLQDVARLNFKGRNAVKFFKEILPEIPESNEFKIFEGKTIYIYPYASPFEKWELVKSFRYSLILHRTVQQKNKGKVKRGKKLKKSHEYSIVYKLSLSMLSPFSPQKEQISDGEAIAPHRAGEWREGAREIRKFILEEFKERKTNKLPVVLALKDGREVKGILKKGKMTRFLIPLQNPENPKEKIFIFQHAIDDFWIDEA